MLDVVDESRAWDAAALAHLRALSCTSAARRRRLPSFSAPKSLSIKTDLLPSLKHDVAPHLGCVVEVGGANGSTPDQFNIGLPPAAVQYRKNIKPPRAHTLPSLYLHIILLLTSEVRQHRPD